MDCVGNFGANSECSSGNECGVDGIITRTYTVTKAEENGGTVCPHNDGYVEVVESCQGPPCAVDCVGSFGIDSSCSATECGTNGVITKTYSVKKPAEYGGDECPYENGEVITVATCSVSDCPVDCVGMFGSYSECSTANECEADGLITKTYTVTQQQENGGTACAHNDGYVEVVESCQGPPCPINCIGSFGRESGCSATQCRIEGSITKTYHVETPAQYGGEDCKCEDGTVEFVRECLGPCEPVDCVGWFSKNSACSATQCSNGFITKTYMITTPAQEGGAGCPYENNYVEVVDSCTGPCNPIDCVGSFGEDSDCSATTCGDEGVQTKTYFVTQEAQGGGEECPHDNGYVEVVCECTGPC